MLKHPAESIKNTFLALKYPNFRLWYIGQIISVLGTMMQSTAQGYLVFELTGSKAYLGYVAFAGGLPSWLLMLFAGVLAERIARKKIILLSQVWLMCFAFGMAALTLLGLIRPWQIVGFAFFTGVAQVMSTPARHAFVSDLVDKEAFTNAISLNSTMFNLGTSIGPAIGGLIYAAVGPGLCFLLNAISFLAVILALLLMKLPPKTVDKAVRQKRIWQDFLEGVRYVAAHKQIRAIIIVTGIFSFFGFSIIQFYPAWAKVVLGGNAATNGFLQSSRGIGAFLSAMLLAFLAQFRLRGRLMTIGLLGLPVFLITFSLVRFQLLSFGICFAFGFTILFVFLNANALVQSMVEDQYRGRVLSVYMLFFGGAHPLGALAGGLIADRLSLPLTLLLYGGILFMTAWVLLLFLPMLRRLR